MPVLIMPYSTLYCVMNGDSGVWCYPTISQVSVFKTPIR